MPCEPHGKIHWPQVPGTRRVTVALATIDARESAQRQACRPRGRAHAGWLLVRTVQKPGEGLDTVFTKCDSVNMTSVTVSTRLDPEELRLLEALAELSGLDRSTLVKSLLRRGMTELRLDHAAEALRKEQVTLSRAAELAGLDVWDFIAGMESRGLELHYGVDELNQDLDAVKTGS